ncbi:MAG: AI-2E family transporter [Acidobacteriota bacterium]
MQQPPVGSLGAGDPPRVAVAVPPPPVFSVTRLTLHVLGLVLALAALLWMLRRLEGVLLLLIVSIFFAYLIAPLVSLMRRPLVLRGRPHALPLPAAIAAVYVVIFGALAIAAWLLLPVVTAEFEQLAAEAPAHLASAQARLQSLQHYERTHLPKGMRDAVNAAVDRSIQGAAGAVQGAVLPFLGTVLGYLPWLVLVPILALFMLKDADLFRQAALRVIPRGRLRWRGDDFFQDVNATLAAYVRAQLIASLFIGAACTIGFALIGVPYAVVLGIVAGVLEFIPLAGPLTVAALAILFASFHSPGQAVAALVFLGVLRIIEDYVVYPRIIGRGIHLHPLAIILAILCGVELGGLAGIFLSIPVVAIVSVAFRHWREHRAEDAGLAIANS